MDEEVYSNVKYYKSSIKSHCHSPQKKKVSFTPMTSKAFHNDFLINHYNTDEEAKMIADGYRNRNDIMKKPKKSSFKMKSRHHSMLDLKRKNKREDEEKDVYDDLIQIIISSLNKDDNDEEDEEDEEEQKEEFKASKRPRKGSQSCMHLKTILPKKEVIEAILFTNTEVISDFYEYTNNCMEIILQMTQPFKSIGKKVDFAFDFSIKKRIAVFDLDETLVHCAGSDIQKGQHKIEVHLPMNKVVNICINIRPNMKKAIKLIMEKYHIVIYTASQQAYSDAVLNYIDPKKKYFNHRLYRHHCVNEIVDSQHVYIKDLSIFKDVDLKDVIIIDNSVLSFAYHLDNGIPILPYYKEKNDSELGCLAYYLLAIDSSYDDLRQGNRKNINLNQILSTVKTHFEQESEEDITDEDNISTTSSRMRKKSIAGTELLQRYETIKEQYLNFTFRNDKEKSNDV